MTNRGALIFILFFSNLCHARIFDLSKEKFGSYLIFSSSQSNLKETPYQGLTVADDFSDAYKYPAGGEFGFMYENHSVGFRFGVEIIKPSPTEGYAKSNNVTKYYYKDNISVLVPKIAMEVNFITKSKFRLLGYGFLGQANLVESTDYSAVTVAPSASHTVDIKSSANMSGGGLAFEFSAFDTTTLIFELGYRQLKFANMIYSKDVTTFEGAVTSGTTVKNSDGTSHQVDMTGAYAALGFRIFLF